MNLVVLRIMCNKILKNQCDGMELEFYRGDKNLFLGRRFTLSGIRIICTGIILILMSVHCFNANAQQYIFEYQVSPQDPEIQTTIFLSDVTVYSAIQNVHYSNSSYSGSVTINGLPNQFSLSFNFTYPSGYSGPIYCDGTVGNSDFIDSPDSGCSSYTFDHVIDAGCSLPYLIYVNIYPIALSLSGPLSNMSFCSSGQPVTLTGTSGFDTYDWQYSVQTGVWNTFAINSSSSYSFGIQDIFGSNYTSHLNKNIYFRYSVGNCDPSNISSNVVGSYIFYGDQLIATSPTTIKPTCQNGSDGSVSVSLSRVLLSGETITTSLYNGNTVDAQNVPNTALKYLGNGTTLNNISAGTYYALIESNYGNCGSPTFTPVTVGPGPRNPVSATASVTSNYNGYSISCPGASDGQITVTASGGSGSLTYSLDGGNPQSSNIFSSVSSGSHTITVKDGCATPSSATTNQVNLSPPS